MFVSDVFADSDIATLSPTCVFLDYLLLHKKADLGGDQVTILPETYTKQQAQLTTVLGKLIVPELASYKTVFYSNVPNETHVIEEVHI